MQRRGPLRQPGLAIAVIAPLALATAISAALFSIVDGLLCRPLPIANADRFLTVDYPASARRRSALVSMLTAPESRLDHERRFKSSPLFSQTIMAMSGGSFDAKVIRESGISVWSVEHTFFDRFGMQPRLGRLFNEGDESAMTAITNARTGVLPVILSYRLWSERFGGDSSCIGKTAQLLERSVLIVGVMPPGVKFPGETDLWTPVRSRSDARGFAELAPGATIEQVREAFPLLDFQDLRAGMRPAGAGAMLFILGAALGLFLLAWVQVASLMLASTSDRVREIAVKRALGARTSQIASQFAGEAAWLAGGALVAAWVMVPSLTETLIGLLPKELADGQYLRPELRTFVFAVGITLLGLAGLALVPLAIARRATPAILLTGAIGSSLSVARTRHRLLVVQLAFTVTLLYLAGLAAHSYFRILTFDYGFDAANVLMIEPDSSADALDMKRWSRFEVRVAELVDRLRLMPEVVAATALSDTPLPEYSLEVTNPLTAFDGKDVFGQSSRIVGVGDEFVEALGGTLLAGATFSDSRFRGGVGVVVINEALARQLSPIVSPIGKRIRTPYLDSVIIGVVKDLVDVAPDRPAAPVIYQPARERSITAHVIVVRTKSAVTGVIGELRQKVEAEFGAIRETQVRFLVDDLTRLYAPWRGRSSLLSLVAFWCLPLAVLGISGGLMFTVRTRAREIGLRMALGASPTQARRLVYRDAWRIVWRGALLGTVCGLVATRWMTNQLFGVSQLDWLTLLVVELLVVGLASIAALLPARRASAIDPAVALRD